MQNAELLNSKIVAVSYAEIGAVSVNNNNIPNDATIPQITEGDQYLTLSHTPKNAANILTINGMCWGSSIHNNGTIVAALFLNAGANAISSGCYEGYTSNIIGSVPLRTEMIAGVTTLLTFRLRAGSSVAANNFTLNGSGGVVRFGGTMLTFLEIIERKP